MDILSLDTSSRYICISYLKNNKIVNKYIKKYAKNQIYILDIISYMLTCRNTDILHNIVYCYGPGSFIGTRLSSSITQGLSFPKKIPTTKLSIMHIYANALKKFNFMRGNTFLIVIQVNDTKYFCALFKILNKVVIRLSNDKVRTLKQINQLFHIYQIIVIGKELKIFNQLLSQCQINSNVYFFKNANMLTSCLLVRMSNLINKHSIFFSKKSMLNKVLPYYLS